MSNLTTHSNLTSSSSLKLDLEDHEAVETFYPIPPNLAPHGKRPHIDGLAQYEAMYAESVQDPDKFWLRHALESLVWDVPPQTGFKGDFASGDITWFADGRLNVAENCIDRHAKDNPDGPAIIWEGDEPTEQQTITFAQLRKATSQLAAFLLDCGITRGDVVTIYLPMIPEAAIVMLACARIGAVHSVVFGGFSAESLAERISDAQSRLLITADLGYRGGKTIPLGAIAAEALARNGTVQNVLIYKRSRREEQPEAFNPTNCKITWWNSQTMSRYPEYLEPVPVSAEHPLFILYTSGSTGKPKGLVHSSAGYLLYTMLSMRWVFDWHPGDRFGAMVDVGWISGHSYVVYGPLANGATTMIYEGTPFYPGPDRFWQLVERWGLTQLYTAPTVIRALQKHGEEPLGGHKLDSLRVLGSVGEPINPSAWRWWWSVVGGQGRCPVVDTYWQTETGGHVLTPLPGAIRAKAGSATVPFFGIVPEILSGGPVEKRSSRDDMDSAATNNGVLVIRKPWPGMARTIYGDHARWRQVYFEPYPGSYFTGDRVYRDADGYYWIRGRVDDVINVSGHRLSTAEIEGALCRHAVCAEAAVLGKPDALTGQAIWAFCAVRPDILSSQYTRPDGTVDEGQVRADLTHLVRQVIGGLAVPRQIVLVEDLPKTRSGKIMRRILRKLLEGERDLAALGDLSTLNNPTSVPAILGQIERILIMQTE